MTSEHTMDVSTSAITNVAVVGAGQMGNGIAHVFATSGHHVIIVDVSVDALARGLDSIARNLDRQVKKGAVTAESAAIEEHLRGEGAAAVHVPARGAADALRLDVEALLEGRPAPSEAHATAPRDEVLR